MSCLQVHDLGRIDYAQALERQRSLHDRVVSTRPEPVPMHLLLLEHDPPVITVSRRPGAADHVVADPLELDRLGVQRVETDRGGDVTWHGPGQLVAYPILDLHRLDLRVHGYMRFLEEAVLCTLASFGVTGHRDASATGVWVGAEGAGRKICAMGVRISRWATLHGLALNVDPDMRHFSLIVPCGLAGRPVTSLRQELGERAPTMAAVKAALVNALQTALVDRLARTGR